MADRGEGEITIRLRNVGFIALITTLIGGGGAVGLRYLNPAATDYVTRADALSIAEEATGAALQQQSAALANVARDAISGEIRGALEAHRDGGHGVLSSTQMEQVARSSESIREELRLLRQEILEELRRGRATYTSGAARQ